MIFPLSRFQLTFVVVAVYAEGLAYKYVCTILHDIFSSSYHFFYLFFFFCSDLKKTELV